MNKKTQKIPELFQMKIFKIFIKANCLLNLLRGQVFRQLLTKNIDNVSSDQLNIK